MFRRYFTRMGNRDSSILLALKCRNFRRSLEPLSSGTNIQGEIKRARKDEKAIYSIARDRYLCLIRRGDRHHVDYGLFFPALPKPRAVQLYRDSAVSVGVSFGVLLPPYILRRGDMRMTVADLRYRVVWSLKFVHRWTTYFSEKGEMKSHLFAQCNE